MSETCCGGACAPAPPPADAGHRHAAPEWPLLLGGGLIAAGAASTWAGLATAGLVAYLGAIALTIPASARRAIASIRRRSLDINVLMVIAVAGAGALGNWIAADRKSVV